MADQFHFSFYFLFRKVRVNPFYVVVVLFHFNNLVTLSLPPKINFHNLLNDKDNKMQRCR